jgi:hypothetical protein
MLQCSTLVSCVVTGSLFMGLPNTLRSQAVSRRVKLVEDCRTRASRPPQTHVRYKAVDGPSGRYTANQIFQTQFHSSSRSRSAPGLATPLL